MFCGHKWRVGCYWHLVGRDQDAAEHATTHETAPITENGPAPMSRAPRSMSPAPDLSAAPPAFLHLLSLRLPSSASPSPIALHLSPLLPFPPMPSKSVLCHPLSPIEPSPLRTSSLPNSHLPTASCSRAQRARALAPVCCPGTLHNPTPCYFTLGASFLLPVGSPQLRPSHPPGSRSTGLAPSGFCLPLPPVPSVPPCPFCFGTRQEPGIQDPPQSDQSNARSYLPSCLCLTLLP